MTVSLAEGHFDAVGTYDDLYDDPATSETKEFFGVQAAEAGTYSLSDVKDDEEGDTDTDTDSDTDGDTDADTDSGVIQETGGLTDTGTPPPEGCPGCATSNGVDGSWAVGAMALAAMVRRRKTNQAIT